MALFWPLENFTGMRKIETSKDGFNSESLQVPVTWILHKSVEVNQAKHMFLFNP